MQSSKKLLAQLDAEIAILQEARRILVEDEYKPAAKNAPGGDKARKKHVMSPEGRKRIAEAQRKRWAAAKKAAKAAK